MKAPCPTPKCQTLETRLARLNELLVSAKDLSLVGDYFLEELAPDDEFMRAGSRAEDVLLLQIVSHVLRVISPAGTLQNTLVVRLEAHGMTHGYTIWNGGLAVFFYFDRTELGFCSFSRLMQGEKNHLVRFSITALGAPPPLTATRQRGSC